MTLKESQDIFQSLRKDAFRALEEASDFEAVRRVESEYLGKKGRLTNILRGLKEVAPGERKQMGSIANALKKEIEEKIRIKKNEFWEKGKTGAETNWLDISVPGKKIPQGHLHPLSRILREVTSIFELMGFEIVEGPEVENEYYNFDALNVPKNHPARDLWDTFWLKPFANNLLLRTHTSPMQARFMEKNNPPLKIVVPGRCFRYEATDATHEIQFYQLEGLMIGEKITLANLKGVIESFFQKLFKDKNLKVVFYPSYFPFVEPGLGIYLEWKNKLLEVAGAGMVHPQVLKNAKLNPKQWQGFAFGLGLDRIAMMKYKINDIRLFYSGDLRFINQF